MVKIAKRIDVFVGKYIMHIYTILGAAMLISIYASYFRKHSADYMDYGSITVLVFVLVMYIISGVMIVRAQLYARYMTMLQQEMGQCYFHGFNSGVMSRRSLSGASRVG